MSSSDSGNSAQPKRNDLFILVLKEGHTKPKLYRVPKEQYRKKPVNIGDYPNLGDMLAHGTVLAAMPPNAGTACYVVNLASMAKRNPALKYR